ncbi:hypothetical protein LUZ60_008629 [Juncus effusus]|nr:hypothetical protein LUZ60_008629 [Juncus effusus]
MFDMKEYLDEYVGSSTRRKTLYYEYVNGLSSTGMQSKHGFEGQINACWTHKMTCQEIDIIRSSGFPIAIIHGRDDVVAQLYNARRLAERLHPAAKMVELHGAHLVSHERPHEVNMALIDLINASKSNVNMKEWSKLPERESESPMSVSNIGDNKAVVLVTLYSLLVKIQLSFLFFMGFFLMFFGHMRNITRILKPVRVLSVES